MVSEALAWWLVLEGAGLVALPIALVLFRRLPGRGYAFAKPVGLLLGGYLFWLALSLHVLPNRPGSIVWVFLLLAAVDAWLIKARGAELRSALEERLGLIVAVEVVFTAAFAVAVYLRSFIPEIGGTEKPMDFMLLNAASRSEYYPPDDAWLAGFDVSYYYFGYVIQAMVGKLAAVPTAVAFNLGLASTAALAVTAAFGLGAELAGLLRRATLKSAVVVGLAAVLLVGVIGNLEGVFEFGIANDNDIPSSVINRLDIANLDTAEQSAACLIRLGSSRCIEYPNDESSFWWWWRATRISPDANSITEFPFFSFLLGDLHPHVMAIPFVLTVVALGLAFWRSEEPLSLDTWRRRPALLLAGAVLVGGLGFLNTWDLPTFGFVLALVVLARDLSLRRDAGAALADAGGFLAPLAVLAALLYAPFYASFSSQAGWLDAVRGGATRPLHSALFWTPLLVASLPLPLVLVGRDAAARSAGRLVRVAALPAVLLAGWALLVFVVHGSSALDAAVSARGWNWLTTLFFAAALVLCLLALWRAVETHAEAQADAVLAPALALMSTAMLLILGSELFFIKDVFGARLNTVFKLSYQAWLLLGVSGGVGSYWVASRWRPAPAEYAPVLRGVWAGSVSFVIACALLYPVGATLSRTDGLSRPNRTLDGLAFARREGSEEFSAVSWLRSHADADERIVEASGGQYSPAARVSAWTGIPTVIGWPGHEIQWGRDGKALSTRERDVDEAYSTASLADALAILRKYDVTYVFVGSVERGKYPAPGLQKFQSGLPTALRVGQTAIYRVPPEGIGGTSPPVEGRSQ